MPEETTTTGALVPWLFACIYAVLLLLLSTISVGPLLSAVVRLIPGGPTGTHIMMYVLLALLFCHAFRSLGRWSVWENCIYAFFLATLYGAAMELLQVFVVSRYACWADVRNNAIGALVGCAVWLVAMRLSRLIVPTS